MAPGNSQAGDMNAKYLHYITAAQIGNAVSGTGSSDYCFETTNTAALAQTRSALTSVLLKARICDKDGGALYFGGKIRTLNVTSFQPKGTQNVPSS